MVSVTPNLPWSKNIKWKVSEITFHWVLSCTPFWVVWWVVSQYSLFFFFRLLEGFIMRFLIMRFFQEFCPTLHVLQALQLNFSCWGKVSQLPVSHTYLGIWFSTWQRGENSLLQEGYRLCLYGECYFCCFVNLVWKIELTILFCSWHTIIVLRRTIFILFIFPHWFIFQSTSSAP